jgi:polysaccharide export outer membrane protein
MRFPHPIASLALLGLTLAAGGCSTLPSAGPNTAQVLGERVVDQVEIPRYLTVELNERAVSILERGPRASLYGRFGERGGEPPASVIGVGDAVQVTVWEAASGGLFSSAAIGGISTGSHSASIPEQVVGRDGAITVPYAGRIHVAGMTPSQVERAIVTHLTGKAIEPQALVTVPHNVSNTVTVTGAVTGGARVPLTGRGDRILDIIATAGGVKAPVHEVFISLSRGDATARAPMQALLTNPRENIYVRPNDVVTVEQQPQTFTVFGAAGRNALVPFDAVGLTVEEAVAKSGGILDSLADPQGVFLLRAEPVSLARELDPTFPVEPGARTVNVVYRINLKDTNTYFVARHMPVHNKDMIYVAASPSNEFSKAMQMFTTAVSAAAQPALIGYTASKI